MDAPAPDTFAPPAPWLARALCVLDPNHIGPGSGDAKTTARILLRAIERDDLPLPAIRESRYGQLLIIDFAARGSGLRISVGRDGRALAHTWTPDAAYPPEPVAWLDVSGAGRDVPRLREMADEVFPVAPPTSNDIISYLIYGDSRVVK